LEEQPLSALFPSYTQDTRLLQLSTPLGPDKLLVECVQAEEALSGNYALNVSLLSLDAAIALKSLLGQPVLLELLTAIPALSRRAFHGHVTAIQMLGANGGFARYTITIAPWTAFLAIGRDSRMFQHKTVCDILDAVFSGYRHQGRLQPAWRYDLSGRDDYPVRSLTCQYQESDFAFVSRLLHEEGLFYYFEHNADEASPAFGSHTLVIADHNGSFKPNAQPAVRFTQHGAVMREDSIDRWRYVVRPVVEDVSMRSWDYRGHHAFPVQAGTARANAASLATVDAPGAYAYPTLGHGQRIASNQLQAHQVRRETHSGAGTVRTLSPGTTIQLHGQPQLDKADSDDGRTFTIVRVQHVAYNNLSAELKTDVMQALGPSPLEARPDSAARPMYRNQFDAIPARQPYRSSDADGHGVLLHPRPTMHGQQTAIVVGPPGAVTHTDRDHRIKVQFHWQRNSAATDKSHSGLDHPAPDGQTGAPADDRSGTWVRVASTLAPLAGSNWGAVAVPRVGSEVLVDFIDGNIDRPVVIGSLYNGKGRPDMQGAAGAGVAPGNTPPWFPGAQGAHAHAAVLSGIKTQAMGNSQTGGGAYNQLVFDDSPGQARVSLQHHATAHAGTAELNLGALRHQSDNQRLAVTGLGAELKTGHSLAARAAKGMLLSADARTTSGAQMDAREAQAQIAQAHALQLALARTAQQHHAVVKGGSADPEALRSIAAQKRSHDVLESDEALGFIDAQLQLSSPAGIVASTPADAVFAAGATTALTAGHDINLVAQANACHLVKDGISLFANGNVEAGDKPVQETGIKLHAASGKTSSQSQAGATRLTADKAVTVASVSGSVNVAAKNHVLLTAQGAGIRLEGSNITLHALGKVDFKASVKELAGPADGSIVQKTLPQAKQIFNEAFVVVDEETGQPLPFVRYRLVASGGATVEGLTDAQGRTQRLFTKQSEQLTIHLLKEE
jgi:type VI secretion system secreted protein VgrG